MNQQPEFEQMRSLLADAQHICVMSHISPDGDAVGSLLGLTRGLRVIGKHVTPVLADEVPPPFTFLPGSQEVIRYIPSNVDVFIAVDTADLDRLGRLATQLPGQPHLNIDHHITNTNYAQINLVDSKLAATAEYLVDLLPSFGATLDKLMAVCLLTGLVTDSLGFRTSNTTPKTLATAQALMEAGAPLHEIYERTLHRRPLRAVKLWGVALSTLREKDGLAWTSLPLSAKAKVGYSANGDADVVSLLTTIEDAEVAVVLVERPHGEVKVSWRATTGMDVAAVARNFGGGGHQAAAGANLHSTKLADAERDVLARTHTALEEFRRNRGAS